MISLSKINKARKLTKTKTNQTEIYIFFYYLNDELYYWKYDDKINLRIDNCTYRSEIKKNCYIPINLLTKI